jgi:plasmid stabilization system protein ParE
MAKRKIVVTWSTDALSHFAEILDYLHSESPLAALTVGKAILDTVEKLPIHPLAHPPDRFRKIKSTDFRAFSVFSYRISYYVDKTEIIILRIRHTSREPLQF